MMTSERLAALAYLDALDNDRKADAAAMLADEQGASDVVAGLIYVSVAVLEALAENAGITSADVRRHLRVMAIAEQIADGIG